MGYLGFWVTQNGIRPINKKVEDMVNMTPSRTQKQVRAFVGLVKYYMSMWEKCSHLLQPLTEIVSNNVKTCSVPRRPLCYHSVVGSENHLFIVEIGPICDKEVQLIFSIKLI